MAPRRAPETIQSGRSRAACHVREFRIAFEAGRTRPELARRLPRPRPLFRDRTQFGQPRIDYLSMARLLSQYEAVSIMNYCAAIMPYFASK
jgi:hypothetical protein